MTTIPINRPAPAARTQADIELQQLVESPGHPVPNAAAFLDAEFGHRERPLLVFQGGTFYRWDGTSWPEIDDHALRASLYAYFRDAIYIDSKENVRDFAPNRYKIADVLDALRGIAHIPTNTPSPSWLGDRENLPAAEFVAAQNGLVHIPTRSLRKATPRLYVHHSVAFEFDPDAATPRKWLAFLDDLWGDDDQSKNTLAEVFGYLLSGDTAQQKIFLLVGPKRSGKGTIARVARAMLGEHNVAGPTLAGLGTNFGLSPLIGRPVAIIADARLRTSDTSIVTERLLSISGEDTLTVDRKYREPWTGQIRSRLVVLSNELPRLADSSGALASRFVVLTMRHSFYGRENPNLTRELCTELPGILNWALDGLEQLRRRGHFVQPQASLDAIRELEDLGSPVGAFIRDRCNTGPEHDVICADLYGAWKAWCDDHGRRATSTQVFGRDLRSVLPSIRVTQPRRADRSNPRTYQGIGLTRTDTRAAPMYREAGPGSDTCNNDGSARVSARVSSADGDPEELF